jgi:uncharacterized protein (TIGR02646 family)
MKYIEKQASPQAFEQWKESKKNRQEDLAKIKDLTSEKLKIRWDNLKSKADIFKLLRESLLKEQGYLCCYCQQPIRLELKTIALEHLIARSIDCTLLFEYTNLLASCLGGKKEETEETNPKYCNQGRGHSHLDITPLQKDCETHFDYFQIEDANEWQIKVVGQTEIAINVIALLNLNTPKLCRLRGETLSPFLENLTVDEANTILNKLRNEINNTLNQPLRPFIQILIKLLEKNYIP